ncbi:hypothetical protein [Aeromicrobium sp. UC242_57]|uniref:hypothetical protein n=1 Tax=Aeromicrobium sp. UC242_57 TaxID=3374624 RepID=UPI003792581C
MNAADAAYILQDSAAVAVFVSTRTADVAREALDSSPVGLRFVVDGGWRTSSR